MYKFTFTLLFLIPLTLFSQTQKTKLGESFIIGSTSFVLGINENYQVFTDDNRTFIEPIGTFARLGYGYEFQNRFALSVNSGYDWHWNSGLQAFPMYGNFRYNFLII